MPFRSPVTDAKPTHVVLVNMPFGAAFIPALGLSILSQQLNRKGISHKTIYYSLSLADLIGARFYQLISEFYPDSSLLIGEWIFSQAVFGASEPPPVFSENRFTSAKNYVNYPDISPASLIQKAIETGAEADGFIRNCAEDIVSQKPKIVALASMFQQNMASIALARAIKSIDPSISVVLGGANCEGPMGAALLEMFPFLDHVVSGPGEISFIELCCSILDGQPRAQIAGVRDRRSMHLPLAPGKELPLDEMANPGFDEFFEQLYSFPNLQKSISAPAVLIETSRGCWWGQKHHCTFCGLNGAEMSFRYKSAEVAYQELKSLESRYPKSKVATVDNIIPMQYFSSLLPALKRSPIKNHIFYETKANLRKSQLRQLVEAGITETQPGIESFSNHVLELMKKGTTWAVNIQYLKWCKQLGITPRWNILYGFPSEKSENYDFTIDSIPYLIHLEPPTGVARIRLDRFSPNFESAGEMGFSNVRPIDSYSYTYRGIESRLLKRAAYFFSADYSGPMEFDTYEQRLHTACDIWRTNGGQAELGVINQGEGALVIDCRGSSTICTRLSKYETEILREIDEATTLESVRRKFGDDSIPVIERFNSLGISLFDGSRLLGLAPFYFEDGLNPSVDLLLTVSTEGPTVNKLLGESHA